MRASSSFLCVIRHRMDVTALFLSTARQLAVAFHRHASAFSIFPFLRTARYREGRFPPHPTSLSTTRPFTIHLQRRHASAFSKVPSSVVVGQVLSAERHPNADNLKLCTVRVGEGVDADCRKEIQIICGASNVQIGQKVCVARVGTVLLVPDRRNAVAAGVAPNFVSLKVKKSKIRGVVSEGMICSYDEMVSPEFVTEASTGIYVLDDSAPIGKPVAALLDE